MEENKVIQFKVVQNPKAARKRFDNIILNSNFNPFDHINQLKSEIKSFEEKINLFAKANNCEPNACFRWHGCSGNTYSCEYCEFEWCKKCVIILKKKIYLVERNMVRLAIVNAKNTVMFEPHVLTIIKKLIP